MVPYKNAYKNPYINMAEPYVAQGINAIQSPTKNPTLIPPINPFCVPTRPDGLPMAKVASHGSDSKFLAPLKQSCTIDNDRCFIDNNCQLDTM